MSEDSHIEVEEDLSSTERQTITRKVRRKQTGSFSYESNRPVKMPKPLESLAHKALATIPELKSFSDLVRENVHLNLEATEKDCLLIAQKKSNSTSSSSSSSKTTEAAAATATKKKGPSEESLIASHTIAYNAKPWDYMLLADRLKALPTPEYYARDLTIKLSEDEMQRALRMRQLLLPTMTAQYEQRLLQQSGVFEITIPGTNEKKSIEFPACSNGNSCVCMQMFYLIPGHEIAKPFIGTAVIFPHHYNDFIVNNIPPPDIKKHRCIMCCRKTLCDNILNKRLNVRASASASIAGADTQTNDGTTFIMNKITLSQMYRNLVNEEGGYFDIYMFFPKGEEAIIDPFVTLNLSSLRVEVDPLNGRIRLNQELMHYKPVTVPPPRIGELESHF